MELREILLSFKTGFNLVNAAVICAISESILGLKHSSGTTEPNVLFVINYVFSALIFNP